MIIPQVGRLYTHPYTGMIVEAVTRRPYETSLLRFPGLVLFAGKTARWDLVGQRIADLKPRDFAPVQREHKPQLDLFTSHRAGRTA